MYLFYAYECFVSTYVYGHMHTCAHRRQKRALSALEMKLEMTVSTAWVWGPN